MKVDKTDKKFLVFRGSYAQIECKGISFVGCPNLVEDVGDRSTKHMITQNIVMRKPIPTIDEKLYEFRKGIIREGTEAFPIYSDKLDAIDRARQSDRNFDKVFDMYLAEMKEIKEAHDKEMKEKADSERSAKESTSATPDK